MKTEFRFEDYFKGADANKAVHKGSGADFYGVRSERNLGSIVALIAKNGDLATTQRVEAARAKSADAVLSAPESIRPFWNPRAVNGPRVDMERLTRGLPRPFGRFERVSVKAPKLVTVYVPIGGRGERSAEEIGYAAVAGIVIVDLLESAGYRCEVWGASCANGYHGETQIRTLLKDAQDPADINAISRIAHPAIFRGLILGLRADRGGNGTVAVDPKRFGDDRACVVVRHSYSEEEAVSEVKRALEAFAG